MKLNQNPRYLLIVITALVLGNVLAASGCNGCGGGGGSGSQTQSPALNETRDQFIELTNETVSSMCHCYALEGFSSEQECIQSKSISGSNGQYSQCDIEVYNQFSDRVDKYNQCLFSAMETLNSCLSAVSCDPILSVQQDCLPKYNQQIYQCQDPELDAEVQEFIANKNLSGCNLAFNNITLDYDNPWIDSQRNAQSGGSFWNIVNAMETDLNQKAREICNCQRRGHSIAVNEEECMKTVQYKFNLNNITACDEHFYANNSTLINQYMNCLKTKDMFKLQCLARKDCTDYDLVWCNNNIPTENCQNYFEQIMGAYSILEQNSSDQCRYW